MAQAAKPMTEEAAQEMETFLDQKTDWRGTCSRCKAHLSGTRRDILGHRCEEEEDGSGRGSPDTTVG